MPLSAGEEEQKQHFDMAANQYPRDAILRPAMHVRLELQHVLDRLKGVQIDGPIVDFGAGTGRLSIALAKEGYSVLAVDISEISLNTLSAVAQDLHLPPIQTSLVFPSQGTFPAIVGADVLHHVDMDEYLPKIYAALREGGKVVFTEPGALNPTWYVYLSLFYDMAVEKRIVHNNLITLHRKFKQYGFRDVRITGLGLIPRPFFNWMHAACRLHDALGNLPGPKLFAYRYIIEASK
jgi:2-polyprenyl-3-methyl-5-hydroxy-6-metoxy-1,4-benzoquinol methylase